MKKVYSLNQTTQNGNSICYLGETVNTTQPMAGIVQECNVNNALRGKAIDEKIFIVHGHDEVSKYELKNYLQNTLKLPEPVILSEVPGQGRTIMECFEEETEKAGIIFVLLTPDDFTDDHLARARQNVIFELGYFIGRLGRKSGRVIVLEKGDVEIPSDLSGILYIRIDHGIKAAGEDIRKAIEAVRQKSCQ